MRKLPYLVGILILVPALAGAVSGPHGNPAKLPMGCASCHVGHGVPGSPMLPELNEDFCFLCHGSPAKAREMQAAGKLDPHTMPANIEAVYQKNSRHPILSTGDDSQASSKAASALGSRRAKCVDCHNHHKVIDYKQTGYTEKKRAPITTVQYEYEMCYRCHGSLTGGAQDISRYLSPSNRSIHPVEAKSKGTGRGLLAPWTVDSNLACTDCHGNNDTSGPKGPHGSDFPKLLSARYETSDGPESTVRYALCYSCHSRDTLFMGSFFPSHAKHVQQDGESCSNCHSSHGSQGNRALVTFGPNVRPSSSGRLEFNSTAAGAGECYLTCHNVEHNPKTY